MTTSAHNIRLLALCACPPSPTFPHDTLRAHTAVLSSAEWEELVVLAEGHGLAPLLHAHLTSAGIRPPQPADDRLRARALQHAHANRLRARVLAEILHAFYDAGIQALVLKGAALAHLVYPHPGLRPMGDVDVLVSRSRVREAYGLLARLGFDTSPVGETLPPKHLPHAKRDVEGVHVVIEVHYTLYENEEPGTTFEALWPQGLPFSLAGVPARTLGPVAMLSHIYRHMQLTFVPFRLLTVADMVAWAEHFVDALPWSQVPRPVRHALATCHWATPLSPALQQAVGFVAGRPPAKIGQEFVGWPRYALATQRHKGVWGILRDTFWPPEWWLRFYYGLPPHSPALWWARLVRHPLWVLHVVCHHLRRHPNVWPELRRHLIAHLRG